MIVFCIFVITLSNIVTPLNALETRTENNHYNNYPFGQDIFALVNVFKENAKKIRQHTFDYIGQWLPTY